MLSVGVRAQCGLSRRRDACQGIDVDWLRLTTASRTPAPMRTLRWYV